jgi:signal transduction histidine kinase
VTRSLALKLIIAFLAVSLVGTILVALLAGQITTNQFGQFVATRNQVQVAAELSEYYRTHGTWEGIDILFPGNRMPRGRGMGPGGMLILADGEGRVIMPGIGRPIGVKVPEAEIARGTPIQVDGQLVATLLPVPGQFNLERDEGAFLSRVRQTLVLAALGATVAALTLGIFLARALTNPLRELTTATRAVAQGKLGHQVEVRSRDELGELATSFNQMSADLARSRDLRRQMTADIAHDLRTPISVILGHAEALRDGVLPPDPETFYIIHDEAKRLNRLVEDLRTLSLAEANELSMVMRPAMPASLLAQAAAAQSAKAQQQDIKVQLDASADLPQVNADADRIAQVLSNLLENAFRHTPPGGEVILGAELHQGQVRLSVHDSGPGIPPEDLPRIFDRFYRADKSRKRHDGGSGLGLAIARSIVLRHGGRIWAESEPGQGATFFIELPIAANATTLAG